MARQQGWFVLILALAIFAGSVCVNTPLNLGLDLRGGSQLTLEVQPTEEITRITPEHLEAEKEVLDRRVNALGVAESTLQTIGNDQLVLQLPGVDNPTDAADVLGDTALLEFRVQKPGTEQELRELQIFKGEFEDMLKGDDGVGEIDSPILDESDREKIATAQKLLGLQVVVGSDEFMQIEQLVAEWEIKIAKLFDPTDLTGKYLDRAGSNPEQNFSDGWEVTLTFDREGAYKFADLTKSIAGTSRRLGIVLDGRSLSEAKVGSEFEAAGITGGAARITGGFKAKEAKKLEVQLRGGSLPFPLEIIQQRSFGPTLGAENIRRSLIAALSGLALVAIFMVIVYRLPGVVAVMALSLYALFNFAVYAWIGVTLTLPGIAGFILSIGMAVDANVLIFERVKDELRRGNTLVRSIEKGFSEALSSIVDGHLTTLISCAALFFLGTGLVKGFAATLGIGVVLSLFTALSCTRTLLRFLMGYRALRRPTNFLPAKQLPSSFA